LNEDPSEEQGGINLYEYVNNNPVNRIDLFGLDGIDLGPGSANGQNIENLGDVTREAEGLPNLNLQAQQKAEQALQNKLNHIFGKPMHKLDCILKKFNGDQKKAFDALNNALKNQKLPDNQLFETTVDIEGKTVTILGRVINGVANIGTAYIK
jgi:hypothetical protein